MGDDFRGSRRNLGLAIRRRRTAAGFSQESFAAEVGIHRTYIGAVERGERNVSLHNLIRIAKALRAPLAALIRDMEAGG
jgi:transcriptional regulator with XRE-family HTH domain